MELPETFPVGMRVLPRFQELSPDTAMRTANCDVPGRRHRAHVLQQATRETLTGMGLDVSGLTDAQMSDNHGWVLFPNFFMTMRAGEATSSWPSRTRRRSQPVLSGTSPASCGCREEYRDAFEGRAASRSRNRASFKYFLALQQDYEQMPRQQRGLRNNRLDHMSLVKEEVVIAHYHSVVDRYLAGTTTLGAVDE